MRKIAFILFMVCAIFAHAQQAGDATIKTYTDTYINTNGTGSITGAQMNQVLNYLISSKVNHDSATTVRIAATGDSLFITYWGYPEDTVVISGGGGSGDTSYFDLAGAILSPKTAIDTLDFGDEVMYVDGENLITTTKGDNAVIIGNDAGSANPTHGSQNILIGYLAGRDIDAGSAKNVAIGGLALVDCDGADNNVAIGYEAMAYGYGLRNVCVGYSSGYTCDGSNNAFLGYYSGHYETGSNRIIIDNIDRSNEANGRSYAPFYSYTNATPSSQVTQIGGTGKVGVGTVSPDSTLHVAGGAIVETDILVGGGWTTWTPTFTWTTSGSQPTTPTYVARYVVTNNTCTFSLYFKGENDGGQALTGVTISVPITPKDVNGYIPIMTHYAASSQAPTAADRAPFFLDMTDDTPANRIIKGGGVAINIANSADYNFLMTASYEIEGR